MTPITRIRRKDAMITLGVKNPGTFDRYAKLLGFTKYPGLRGNEYDKNDIIKKWNTTQDQLIKKLKTEI